MLIFDLSLYSFSPFLCSRNPVVKIGVVELVIRGLLAAIGERHGDWPHAQGIHLVRAYYLCFWPDELLDVVRVRHYDVFAGIAVPEERGLDFSQAIGRIVGIAVCVLYRIADKVKQDLGRNLVAQDAVPDRVVAPVHVERRSAAKKRGK